MSKKASLLASQGLSHRSVFTAFLAFIAISASADGISGRSGVVTEQRSVAAFRAISIAGSGTLRVHRGEQKVELSCDSRILPYITTTVEGGTLKVRFKPFVYFLFPRKVEFDITLPELAGLSMSGSGSAYIDHFKGDLFTAELSGSGGMNASLEYKSIDISSSGSGGLDATIAAGSFALRRSGSGGVYLTGSAEKADIVLNGSGELGARNFSTQEARIVRSGSGFIEIRATRTLDVALSGSGELRYWGNPSIMQVARGSGRIIKAGN